MHPNPSTAQRLLADAVDRRGRHPLDWAAEPLSTAARVLVLGPTAPHSWIRIDPAPESRPDVVGAATRLPVLENGVDGCCLLLTLAAQQHLDALFAEVRRVLRPSGTLVVITPSATPRAFDERHLRAVHRAGWANRSALDTADWLLAAADFALLTDERVRFTVDRPGETLAHDLRAAGIWPPSSDGAQVMPRARAGQRWPVPLRRLVARR